MTVFLDAVSSIFTALSPFPSLEESPDHLGHLCNCPTILRPSKSQSLRPFLYSDRPNPPYFKASSSHPFLSCSINSPVLGNDCIIFTI